MLMFVTHTLVPYSKMFKKVIKHNDEDEVDEEMLLFCEEAKWNV